MKRFVPALVAAIAISQGAIAADNSNSPYDTNPACRDRNVDSTKGDCIIKDTGTPRHTYPPRTTTTGISRHACDPRRTDGARGGAGVRTQRRLARFGLRPPAQPHAQAAKFVGRHAVRQQHDAAHAARA